MQCVILVRGVGEEVLMTGGVMAAGGGGNCQGFGEDANCAVGVVIGGKCNKLWCVLHHCACS